MTKCNFIFDFLIRISEIIIIIIIQLFQAQEVGRIVEGIFDKRTIDHQLLRNTVEGRQLLKISTFLLKVLR